MSDLFIHFNASFARQSRRDGDGPASGMVADNGDEHEYEETRRIDQSRALRDRASTDGDAATGDGGGDGSGQGRLNSRSQGSRFFLSK